MFNNKGFTSIEIFIVVLVFTAMYSVVMINATYAYENDADEIAYSNKINIIENQAQIYASLNEDLFEDTTVIYFYVEDLIESNLIVTNEEGNVANPLSETSNLNNLKIKVVLIDGEYIASVVEV